MALSHPVMVPWVKREMPAFLKKHLDPIPFLPNPTKRSLAGALKLGDGLKRQMPRVVLPVKGPTWTEVAVAILEFIQGQGVTGDGIIVEVPGLPDEEDVEMSVEAEVQNQVVSEAMMESPVESKLPIIASKVGTDTKDGNDENDGKETKDGKDGKDAKGSESNGKESRERSLPTRKRSQSAAGVDGADEENGIETRRKRIRRRDTAVEEAMDPSTLHATQLAEYQAADQNLFKKTKDILENLGVSDKDTLDRLAETLDICASSDRPCKTQTLASNDLRSALASFKEETAKILSNKKDQAPPSLSSFLDAAKSGSQKTSQTPDFDELKGLKAFVDDINSGWVTMHDLGFAWVKAVSSTYLSTKWSEAIKTALVQIISRLDGEIYRRIVDDLTGNHVSETDRELLESIVQMLFELHLDVYERIINPNSIVEYSVREETKARVARWQRLATSAIRESSRDQTDDLCVRFMWASVWSSTLTEPKIRRDHVLQCWSSLRDFLAEHNYGAVHLPNNGIFPSISPAAADREISKLTTMDFFLGLFQDDLKDPVAVIESLEPVLNPSSVCVQAPEPVTNGAGRPKAKKVPIKDHANQGLLDLWKFLRSSNTELRLFLWSRLSEAYAAIKYPTKQFSCHLRSIEMVVADLSSDTFVKTPDDTRVYQFMRMLKSLDELLIQALTMALNDTSAFDIIDDDHLRQSSACIAKLNCILHTAAMFEDEVRIGMTPSPSNSSAYNNFLNKLREMQVRAWCLQYAVLKVGIKSKKDIFPTPENEFADYLAAIHHVMGLRKSCKASNKIFLKMMRVELLKLKNIENWEDYLGQVLYDLHGLKLGVGIWEVQDHGCPPEKLEKRNTMQLVDRITVLANRMPIKDLLKSDLKTTIEHMQQTIGQPKSTPQMIHHLRNFTEFLKKPIHPLRLYRALKGSVTIDAVGVHTPESSLAKRGWFFLLGMIALTKFKGVDLNRRQTPGATDDLRVGAQFLRLQLQFTPDKWDAWFRLAECFDYELDEAVLWTADKINKERAELTKLQKNAIHCYTLALSNSCDVDPEGEDADALYEMYHKFAMRLYASSRQPFAMEAFEHGDQKRFFIGGAGGSTYEKTVHKEMEPYQVWRFAARLFKRAMALKPKDWRNFYMHTKCLWKMYEIRAAIGDKDMGEDRAYLVECLQEAVRVVAAVPKSRHSDPILEPHYKILTILNKLVLQHGMPIKEAGGILSKQPFGLPFGDGGGGDGDDDDDENPIDKEDWEEYVITSLRHLRDKDKSNWQHRLIMRHARILFDDQAKTHDYVQAKAAFNVLRESMFTKTMAMNVWKCDAERPGRHHVYTEQYERFMVNLLLVLNDRTNLELLLRKIRKKGADFYHFHDMWQHSCMAYLRLLRQSYQVMPSTADPFKNVSAEEFEGHAETILEWAATSPDMPAYHCLKDTIELKKLNVNLMKATAIDDLVADCYGLIFQHVEKVARSPPSANVESDLKEEHVVETGLKGVLHAPAGLASRADTPMTDRPETETAVKPRKQGVRRPDILRKAEQVVLRGMEPPKSAGLGGRPKSRSRGVSVASAKTGDGAEDGSDVEMEDVDAGEQHEEEEEQEDGGAEGEVEEEADEVEGEGEDEEEEGHDETAAVVSEPAGSIHSSADESDLSDVPDDYDDEEPPGFMLFPNLGRSGSRSAPPAGEGEDEEGEEEEEEEEEDVEEEDGRDEEEEDGGEEEDGQEDDEEEAEEEVEEEEGQEGEGI